MKPHPVRKRDVQNFYNKIARSYDELYGEEQKEKFRLALNLNNLKLNGKVLDAGCGTGLLEEFLGGRVEAEKLLVFGVDISRGVLNEAKKKFSGKQNIFLICGDIDYLPFPDKMFNSCMLFTVLQNLPQPEKTMGEVKRVAKKNALIVVTYLRVKASLEEFRLLIGKSGIKGKFFDNPKINEYVFVGRIG
ncbi:MAG: hypothetical protein DRO36_02940 [Candidatus Hecatellales archaeon]|nr:MAG: hypothetical protein DRO36_02940 [Candidatus Hecatellales archaeon]